MCGRRATLKSFVLFVSFVVQLPDQGLTASSVPAAQQNSQCSVPSRCECGNRLFESGISAVPRLSAAGGWPR
jgi:hypothetical protein